MSVLIEANTKVITRGFTGKGGAEDKIAAMEAGGIRVSPARLGKTLVEVLKG